MTDTEVSHLGRRILMCNQVMIQRNIHEPVEIKHVCDGWGYLITRKLITDINHTDNHLKCIHIVI